MNLCTCFMALGKSCHLHMCIHANLLVLYPDSCVLSGFCMTLSTHVVEGNFQILDTEESGDNVSKLLS